MTYHEFAIDLVRRAGERIKKAHTETLAVSYKEDDPRNPVTAVDIEVSEFLTAEINKAFPDHRVYSEEGTENRELAMQGFEWVLDPIDGTGNFSHHIPHFSICVALLEDGVPLCGAIFNPLTGELFNFKGKDAFLNGDPIRVSAVTAPGEAQGFLSVGHKEPLWRWGKETHVDLLRNLNKLKNLGSANLDLAYLAAGRAEIVVYGTFSMPDGVAGVGLVRAAGGEVYILPSGDPVSFTEGRKTIVAVANRQLFEKIKPYLHVDLLPQ